MQNTIMIKKKGTFKYLFNKGSILKGEYLSIYYIYSKKRANYFGVCVSKKNGNSVSRNKLKRWVREIYKENEKRIKLGIYIIVSFKKDITMESVNYTVLKDDLESLFVKGDLYDK